MGENNNLEYHIGEDSQIEAWNDDIYTNTYPLDIDKHNENAAAHLANAGPVGIAAAEAISSCRYFESSFHFEINPAVRKRLQTRLLRKINSTMDEYTIRLGQQIAMLNCIPSSKLPPVQQFKIYGSKKIELALISQRSDIMIELDKFLANKMGVKKCKMYGYSDNEVVELPTLNVDGIPTPLDKMTQLQLRNFIPEMLRLSTGRVKPGWKRFEFCPVWWPSDVPWANIRTDVRSEKEKKAMSWTACLSSIILSCYQYHNCEHRLPDYKSKLNSFNKSEEDTTISMDPEEPPLPIENIDMDHNNYKKEGKINLKFKRRKR